MAGGLAIVLSGGGAKGAFQVGVVHELVVNRGVRLDIVAGVSTGAIQALGVAQDDVPGLLDAWLGIKGNGSIYRERPLGVVGGILGEDAIYDAAPLKRLLKGFADEEKLAASGRMARRDLPPGAVEHEPRHREREHCEGIDEPLSRDV